jgi:hypothetical protein
MAAKKHQHGGAINGEKRQWRKYGGMQAQRSAGVARWLAQ